MPSSIPQITESEILLSYLLPPAPLSTILPYKAFLNLVPATYRNSQDYREDVNRLYRDLQAQRSTIIDQVRLNIDRECGLSSMKAATLRARLAQQIMVEEGEDEHDQDEHENEARRKRRRIDSHSSEDEDESDGIEDKHNEFTDPVLLAAQRAMYEDLEDLHSAAHVLPVELEQQVQSDPTSTFHTRDSLLRVMDEAGHSLNIEVEELEAECERIKAGIAETVGMLSDLRYGQRQSGGEIDDANAFTEPLSALEQFGSLLRSKAKTS